MYLARVRAADGSVHDHYAVGWTADEVVEAALEDERWEGRRPVAVLSVTHRGAVVWTPLDAPIGAPDDGASTPRASGAAAEVET